MSVFHSVQMLSSDGAVALASFGLLLIFLECNRPGRVIPSSLGLLSLLLASANLFRHGLQLWAVSVILIAVAIALWNLYRRLPLWLLLLSGGGWIIGLRFLVHPEGASFVHTPVALLAGGLLGTFSTVLTRIAYRARRAKALN